MKNLKRYHFFIKLCVLFLLVQFCLFGNVPQFSMAYFSAFLFLTLRALCIHSKKRMKFMMIISYGLIFFLQLSFTIQLGAGFHGFELRRLFCSASILFPFALERFFIVNKYAAFYFPSVQDISTFTFNELKNSFDGVLSLKNSLIKNGKALSIDNLGEIASDLPRHNSFRYINNGSLTHEYFAAAQDSLDDPNIYIVISNTGSAASELISVFTKRQYNHASLSFDADLRTIISYNGGEKLYPPGLNPEMIEFFNQKPDASVIVYRMEAERSQKELILEKVREINEQGSAYNILGLVLKYSHKSNILFCSQFVYKMLKCAGLQYFLKNDADVKPMDFVELDVRRKLHFAYEILFAEKNNAEQKNQINI